MNCVLEQVLKSVLGLFFFYKNSAYEHFAKFLVSHLTVCHHGLADLLKLLFRPIFTHVAFSLMFGMCMYALVGKDSKTIMVICWDKINIDNDKKYLPIINKFVIQTIL